MKYNYSIIIPHKNSPKLLKRCLNSIPEREDIQIIVVDDNSDKDIVDFESFPGKDRNNIELIFSKEGKGAGFARNIGLNHAIGKWILFADADDFYKEGFITILDKYKDSDIDVLYFSVLSVDSDTLVQTNRNNFYDEYIYEYSRMDPKSADKRRFNKWEPWNRMIRKTYIDIFNLKFEEISRCNDMIFGLLSSFLTNKYDIIPNHLYCVTYSKDSMTFGKTSKEAFCDCICSFKKRNIFLDKIGHREWKTAFFVLCLRFLKKEGVWHFFSLIFAYLKQRSQINKECAIFYNKMELL